MKAKSNQSLLQEGLMSSSCLNVKGDFSITAVTIGYYH